MQVRFLPGVQQIRKILKRKAGLMFIIESIKLKV
jgi:hypothetical protein